MTKKNALKKAQPSKIHLKQGKSKQKIQIDIKKEKNQLDQL